MVSPAMETTQDSVLSMIFPFFVNLRQANSVTSVCATPQLSDAVAVNEIGTSAGTMAARALQSMSGGVRSKTVTLASQESLPPTVSVTVNVTSVDSSGYGPGGS